MTIYIIGYGTLLYTESVGDTIGSGAEKKGCQPVIIHGFKRLFNLLPSHYKPSYKISKMPVEKAAAIIIVAEDASFNGIAFEVNPDELKAIDRRESHYHSIETPMYDRTTFLADGNMMVTERYSDWLDELIINK
jgi:hypothetical protein